MIILLNWNGDFSRSFFFIISGVILPLKEPTHFAKLKIWPHIQFLIFLIIKHYSFLLLGKWVFPYVHLGNFEVQRVVSNCYLRKSVAVDLLVCIFRSFYCNFAGKLCLFCLLSDDCTQWYCIHWTISKWPHNPVNDFCVLSKM